MTYQISLPVYSRFSIAQVLCYLFICFNLISTASAENNNKYDAFSCAKVNAKVNAKVDVEALICSYPGLAALVNKMSLVYNKKILSVPGWELDVIKKEQEKWFNYLSDECGVAKLNTDVAGMINCLGVSYKNRLADINASYKERIDYYRRARFKSRFTPYERQRWRRFIQWPDSCEFENLEFMDGAGLSFIKLNNNYFLLAVTCERYVTESHLALYLIDDSVRILKSSPFPLQQVKYEGNKWMFYQSNIIKGQFSFLLSDVMEIDIVKWDSPDHLCGRHSLYEVLAFPSENPSINLTRLRANTDCAKKISYEDWQIVPVSKTGVK